MDLKEPKFINSEYAYYDNTGLKIKEDSPQWVKDEYNEFMNSLDEGIIRE